MRTHTTGIKRALGAVALALALAAMLAGCADQSHWEVRNEPTTDEERQLVAQQVVKLVHPAVLVLAGHDQDWDDAIKAATESAKTTLCRPTLWEWREGWTGKWRYIEERK